MITKTNANATMKKAKKKMITIKTTSLRKIKMMRNKILLFSHTIIIQLSLQWRFQHFTSVSTMKTFLLNITFSERWILNFDCNQYMIENFNVFIFFIFFVKQNFFERWILNFNCNQHMIENFNTFISFIFFAKKIISDVESNLVIININSIRLYIKIKNESFYIIIHNVWYIFNSKYNLLFYNIFKNVEIFMIIKDYDFEINSQEIRAIKNENFYFLIF